jgi:hypothetical protein
VYCEEVYLIQIQNKKHMTKIRKKSPSLFSADVVSAAQPSITIPHDLAVSVAKSPLAFNWRINIEGQTYHPADFSFDGKLWTRNFPQFPVTGTLDVVLEGQGIDNGVQRGRVAARVNCDGTDLSPDLDAVTIKGYGIDRRSYVV